MVVKRTDKWCILVHYTSGAREKLVYNKSTSNSLAVAYKELERLSRESELHQWEGIADFSVSQC